MLGKPTSKPGLFDDGSLMSFLQSTLETMELAAGQPLGEERAKLQELQRALGGLGASTSVPSASLGADADELVLASQLDKLEEQLAAVEQQIATADNGTKKLLTAAISSSSMARAGGSPDSSGTTGLPGGSSPGASSAAGSTGATGKSDDNGAATICDNGTAVDAMTMTGLLPVMEQPEEGGGASGSQEVVKAPEGGPTD